MNLKDLPDDILLAEVRRRKLLDVATLDLQNEISHLSDKIRKAERIKSIFVSNVRNEMNNPLTALLGLSSTLAEMTDERNISRVSKLIYREVFELDFQLRNIITSAEIENGDIRIAASHVDLSSLISSQLRYLEPRLQASDVQVDHHHDGTSDFISDPYILQTIVLNVVANSIEFSKPGSTVQIQTSLEGSSLQFVVEDKGIGIVQSQLDEIFDRFRQSEMGTTKTHKGQGLGLSVVAAMVDLLNGELTVDSIVGMGTTFRITIPSALDKNLCFDSSEFGNEVLFNDAQVF